MKSKSRKPRVKTESKMLTAKLVRIGNSRGIRLPKAVIEQVGLIDNVEVSVRGEEIVIRPAAEKPPRGLGGKNPQINQKVRPD